MSRRFSYLQRLSRLVRLRLIVPLKRSPHPPEYSARGVMMGLFWGFTPLLGGHMILVGLTWLLIRRFPRFDFSLIIGMAWTWVINVFTMWPAFYLFYVTGQVLLVRPEIDFGYDRFVAKWQAVLVSHEGFIETLSASTTLIAHEQGLPLIVGCLPYAIGSAWLGYRWSLAYLRRRQARRAARLQLARLEPQQD